MQRKTLLLLAGTGVLLLAIASAGVFFGVRFVRGLIPTPTPVPKSITLCDRDASGLCVISFSTNSDNEMVINLQLADEEFPAFYASVTNRGTVNRFRCSMLPDLPPAGTCSGARTPLGEPLLLRLFAKDDDALLAEGNFVLMALALPTFSNATATLEGTFEPGQEVTETPTLEFEPTLESTPTPTATRTPGTAYP